ncbi:MAG: glutamate--tRNA ligase [bacterium]|nr:glutamate--tRNA ligase [bacterium]
MDAIRVRFAPSPTGELHIGNARTALFCWLFARSRQGRFILRIEDTDPERNREDGETAVQEALAWLGMDWDEGPDRGGPFEPYRQSERLALYHEHGRRLLAGGQAYPCFCSPRELARRRAQAGEKGRAPGYDRRCRDLTVEERQSLRERGLPHALRLKSPLSGQTVVSDLVRGEVRFLHGELDDFILVRSDGRPTYNFACVVDDHLMRISHVIRGEEHLSNTPRQSLLYQALEYPLPEFAHIPMILAPDRSKLSKRHGATSVQQYRDQGYLPEALANYLALLGWSYPGGREVFSLEEAARCFSLDRISPSASVYDDRKIEWLNGHYLRELPPGEVARRAMPFMRAEGYVVDENRMRDLVAATQDRVKLLAELPDALSYYFRDDFDCDEAGFQKHLARPGAADLLERGCEVLAGLAENEFTLEGTERAYRDLAGRLGIRAAELIHPTRLALTGRTVGPGLFTIMVLLGRQETLARLRKWAERLRVTPA